jgi:hypothetical protein
MSFQPRLRSAGETNPGTVCCSSPVAKHRCPKCQPDAVTTAEAFAAPDPYAADIAKLRAAAATPASTFEAGWKADRLATLDAERAAGAALKPGKPARLTAAESSTYAPPNGYRIALDAMKENR